MIKTKNGLRSGLTIIAGCLLMNGCSSSNAIPDSIDETWKADSVREKMVDEWRNQEQPVTYIPGNANLVLEKENRLPSKIYNQTLKTKFNGKSTMKDLVVVLKRFGLYLVIPDEDVRDKPIVMIDFEGKLGDFLTAIEAAYSVSFNYHQGNIVTVDNLTSFQLRIPQDEEIAKQIKTDLDAMGAEGASYSVHAGTIFYKATQKNHRVIMSYLERLSVNTSLVSMQVAVITLRQELKHAKGVDWSKLSMDIGMSGSSSTSASSESSDDSSDDDSDIVDTVVSAVGLKNEYGGSLTGSSSTLQVARGDFSMTAVIDYLSTYGDTEATQSLLLKTLSGREVSINSGQKVPYIDEIGGSSSSDDDDDSDSSSTNVEFLDLGTKLKLVPWYDADNQFITVNIDLEISGLTGWIELNAGNEVGTVTQPQTNQQEFTDVIKVIAGDSVIIGGISQVNISDNRNAPIFLDKTSATYRSLQETRDSTFIIIRPTVTVFGADKE